MSTSLEQAPSTREVCPVCSSGAVEFQFAKRGMPILRCTQCDTAFHPAKPTVDALRDLYSERYFTAGGFEGYPDYLGDEPAHRTQGRYYLNRLRKLGIPTGRVLDVGCAAGFFLDEARSQGWECSGCDISEFAARHAREALGLDAVHAPFLEAEFPEGTFDLITLFSVIAHLPDPPVVAKRLHALLKPGGYLLLETSNRDALAPRLLGPRWHLCSPPSVLYFFNRRSLQRLFGAERWRLVDFSPSIKWISLDHGLSRVEGRAGRWVAKGIRAFRRAAASRLMVPYLGRDIAIAVFQKR
jgi:SAM-dependent methyltransferase